MYTLFHIYTSHLESSSDRSSSALEWTKCDIILQGEQSCLPPVIPVPLGVEA